MYEGTFSQDREEWCAEADRVHSLFNGVKSEWSLSLTKQIHGEATVIKATTEGTTRNGREGKAF